MACLGALVWATAYTPAFSQTSAPSANGTDAAQERSQRQSDSVYRWIKLHAEPARKPEGPKLRTRPESNAAPPRKPDARTASAAAEVPAVTADTVPTADSQASAALPTQGASEALAPAMDTPVAAAPAPVVEVEVDLKPVFQPQPEIPREMRASIANGRVVLGFTVRPDGTVSEASVLRTTNRRLGKPALDAVSQWRFEPIRLARTAQVEIEFTPQ